MNGLTFEVHYAIVALTCMAQRHGSGGLFRVREISAREGLPASFLSKILLKLRRGGLVQARHGRGGGYRLSRSPFSISVQDVLVSCGDPGRGFDLETPAIASNAALVGALDGLNRRVQRSFEETTIADLAGLRSERPGQGRAAEPQLAAAV